MGTYRSSRLSIYNISVCVSRMALPAADETIQEIRNKILEQDHVLDTFQMTINALFHENQELMKEVQQHRDLREEFNKYTAQNDAKIRLLLTYKDNNNYEILEQLVFKSEFTFAIPADICRTITANQTNTNNTVNEIRNSVTKTETNMSKTMTAVHSANDRLKKCIPIMIK